MAYFPGPVLVVVPPDIGGNTNDVPNNPSFHFVRKAVAVIADRYYFDPTSPDAEKLDPDKIRPIHPRVYPTHLFFVCFVFFRFLY